MLPEKCYFCTDLKAWVRYDVNRRATFGINLVVNDGEGQKFSQTHDLFYCPECGTKIDFDALYSEAKEGDNNA